MRPPNQRGARKGGPVIKLYIVGPVASGKTTLARRLSQALGVPCVHLDECVYSADPTQPWGNQKRPAAERDALFSAALAQEHFILEDTGRVCFSEALRAADTVLLLDLPSRVRRRRIAARWLRQKLGLERASYRPSRDVLRCMYQWTRAYDTGEDDLRARLSPFAEKTVVLRRPRDVEAYLRAQTKTPAKSPPPDA